MIENIWTTHLDKPLAIGGPLHCTDPSPNEQQFVTPGICRHQTTYELIAHFRLLNFAIQLMRGFGGDWEGKTHQGPQKTTERAF